MAETLETIIRRRAPVPVAEKLTWMMALCAELAQAHAAGIVHGDIRPATLAVDDQGRLTILDLGTARPRTGASGALPGTQLGAPAAAGYKSPEQIEGAQVDHRTDLFAVGAVCYELLAYTPAFPGSSVEQVERSVLAGTPAPLVSRLPELDPEVDEVVLRALKRDPNKRYQDAATFERALGRVRDRVRERTQAVDSAPTVVALPSPTVAGTPAAPQAPPPGPPVAAPRPGAGRRFRSARAEAAYRRALDASRTGALDAARRFAAEAVAEDPSSPEARELLARLGGRAPRADGGVPPRPAAASEPTVAGSWAQGPGGAPASTPTILASRREPAMPPGSAPTIISPRPGASSGPSASLPTIIVDPGSSGAGSSGATVALERDRSSRQAAPVPGSHQPIWVRHRVAVLVTALLLIGAIAAAVVVVGLRFLGPAGPRLTVQKPTGGTLVTRGIVCGTGGTDCTENVSADERIELEPRPDEGYTFGTFTGDCAPSGRVTMSGPRTCGATFVMMPKGGDDNPTTQVLTISPIPAGGTVVGVEINCGSRGTTCSGNYPVDQDEDLNPMPDEGYSFMGFAGDCTRDGRVKMSGARTCTATFAPTPIATTSVPFVPDSQRQARRDVPPNRGGTTTDVPAGGRPPTPGPDGPPPGAPGLPTPSGGPDTAVPLTPPVAGPTQKIQDGDAAKPLTDEEYAKSRIKQLLLEWCAAYQAIDPDAVQRLYPLVDMTALRMQLNKEKYRSVQCKIGEPEYLSLDAGAGRAKVKAELTRVYQHTILTKKKETSELVATVTLTRPAERSQWRIDAATYEPK